MIDYPTMAALVNRVEAVPRRVRGMFAGRVVFDTTRALYLWESEFYPQFYIPAVDVDRDLLVDQHHRRTSSREVMERLGLRVGELTRDNAASIFTDSPIERIIGTVRFEWGALEHWFEEDEEIFVHPRNPYVRVDALRSTRRVRVELDGIVLAESASTVMVFETGLPTRYYFNRTEVSFDNLRTSATETSCPYKGKTTEYWSVVSGDEVHPDLAWTYDFPTRELTPIAGMIAFYNEKVDVFVDGELQERPVTHFF